MKMKTLMLATVAGLLLTACIPSMNPFYSAKDIVFEPTLLGEWTASDSSDEPQHWKFERHEDSTYDLTVRDEDGAHGHFKATLFKLENHTFLDLIPSECDYTTNQTDLVAFAMFPGHLLIHVTQIKPELKMAFCDFEWLGNQLEDDPKALMHHTEDERILLTASTKQLQRFVLKHLKSEELFSDYGTLTRDE